MRRRHTPQQPSLFDELEPQQPQPPRIAPTARAAAPAPNLPDVPFWSAGRPASPPQADLPDLSYWRSLSYREALMQQIRRDMQTLRMPDEIIEGCSDRAFFEERIAAYREEVRRIDQQPA